MQRLAQGVRLLFVYIAEAHALDEWPVLSSRHTADGEDVRVDQTRTLAARISRAAAVAAQYGYSDVLVAPPEGTFELLYRPWPFRIFGFDDTTVTLSLEPLQCSPDLHQLAAWLNTFMTLST